MQGVDVVATLVKAVASSVTGGRQIDGIDITNFSLSMTPRSRAATWSSAYRHDQLQRAKSAAWKVPPLQTGQELSGPGTPCGHTASVQHEIGFRAGTVQINFPVPDDAPITAAAAARFLKLMITEPPDKRRAPIPTWHRRPASCFRRRRPADRPDRPVRRRADSPGARRASRSRPQI